MNQPYNVQPYPAQALQTWEPTIPVASHDSQASQRRVIPLL